jgi:hypothetical protein
VQLLIRNLVLALVIYLTLGFIYAVIHGVNDPMIIFILSSLSSVLLFLILIKKYDINVNIVNINSFYIFLILFFVILFLSIDRGYDFILTWWNVTRASSGLLSSLAYILLTILASLVIVKKLNLLIKSTLFIIIAVISIAIGSRIIILAVCIQYILISINKGKIYKSFFLLLICISLVNVARWARSSFDEEQFNQIFAASNYNSILSGELEIFDYAENAYDLISIDTSAQNSYLYVLSTPLFKLRRSILGIPFQEKLWIYAFENNINDLQLNSDNQRYFEEKTFGTHHPTFALEYYRDGFYILSPIFSILLFSFLIYLSILFLNLFNFTVEILCVPLTMTCLFFVRGNSIVGITQWIMTIIIFLFGILFYKSLIMLFKIKSN